MALFRFYDPRIMAAFVATLPMNEAVAFMGCSEQLVTAKAEAVQIKDDDTETQVQSAKALGAGITVGAATVGAGGAVAAKDNPISGGRLYVVNNEQMVAMSDVAEREFREKLILYLREVWTEYVDGMSNEEIDEVIDLAILDGMRMENTSSRTLMQLSVVRVIDPTILTDENRWKSVLTDSSVNKRQRPSYFIGPIAVKMSLTERAVFLSKLNKFNAEY